MVVAQLWSKIAMSSWVWILRSARLVFSSLTFFISISLSGVLSRSHEELQHCWWTLSSAACGQKQAKNVRRIGPNILPTKSWGLTNYLQLQAISFRHKRFLKWLFLEGGQKFLALNAIFFWKRITTTMSTTASASATTMTKTNGSLLKMADARKKTLLSRF